MLLSAKLSHIFTILLFHYFIILLFYYFYNTLYYVIFYHILLFPYTLNIKEILALILIAKTTIPWRLFFSEKDSTRGNFFPRAYNYVYIPVFITNRQKKKKQKSDTIVPVRQQGQIFQFWTENVQRKVSFGFSIPLCALSVLVT